MGRAGGLVIGRSWVESRLPWGGTELHVEVSLSKTLNRKIAPDVQLAPCVATSAISKGPVMSWRLIQGVLWPSPIANWKWPLEKRGINHPCDPHGKSEGKRYGTEL